MNVNLAAAGAVWDAVPKEVRGAWYALSGLEMPALVESIDVMLGGNFDHFEDSERLVLAMALDAVSTFAAGLYACGVLVLKSEPRTGGNSNNEGANDEKTNVVDISCARGRIQ